MERNYIDIHEARTLYGLFQARVSKSPDAEAYRYFDFETQRWNSSTWAEMAEHVACWQSALLDEGMRTGDRVAVMLRNCREWVMLDQAALGLGLVVVPLYNDDRADSIAYILRDSGARFLLIEGDEQWTKLEPVRDHLGDVDCIVCLNRVREGPPDERLRAADDWLPADAADMASPIIDPDALATIVYTSGTTGRPKGVMLSHHNILSNAASGLESCDVYADDLFLSFLPLSHTLERTVGYYVPIMAGSTVAYARSIKDLAEDLKTVRPTLLISVPRIFERVYNRIHEQLQEKPAAARRLFESAVAIGWRKFLYQQGRASWTPKLLLNPLLRRLVGKKILDRLGGRLRFAISGGAALPAPVAEMFIGLGLEILQGYGLTENSPVISVNRREHNDPTSVGEPVPDVEIKLGSNNELLVRGPSVMKGYWNDPEATAAMVDSDGWLHTGDRVAIEDHHIYITGRIKEIIVLSNGEKIPPEDMEIAVAIDPLFEQVMIIGEQRPYLAALLVVNTDLWRNWAGEDCARSAAAVLDDAYCQQRLLDRIAQCLKEFPGYAQVRRAAICEEPWSIDNGLLTPTLKPKRRVIAQHYADKIERIYEGHK